MALKQRFFCAHFLVKEVIDMVKQLTKGKEWLNNAYWSAVGMATATMLTMQPVLATATGTGISSVRSGLTATWLPLA